MVVFAETGINHAVHPLKHRVKCFGYHNAITLIAFSSVGIGTLALEILGVISVSIN